MRTSNLKRTQSGRLRKLEGDLERITQGDRNYFARFPDRRICFSMPYGGPADEDPFYFVDEDLAQAIFEYAAPTYMQGDRTPADKARIRAFLESLK
jgi:hypothetical protein